QEHENQRKDERAVPRRDDERVQSPVAFGRVRRVWLERRNHRPDKRRLREDRQHLESGQLCATRTVGYQADFLVRCLLASTEDRTSALAEPDPLLQTGGWTKGQHPSSPRHARPRLP